MKTTYYNPIQQTINLIKETNFFIVVFSFFEMIKYIIKDFTLKYGFKNLYFDYLDTFQNVIVINSNNFYRWNKNKLML